ncbi:MAG: RnfABCDGE type electron transport complex subunit B [Bacillota bacterium]
MIYIYAILSMGGIAAILAAGLGFASNVFKVEVDERIEEVDEVLPAANCGACGYAGCNSFAEAVVNGEAEVDGCPVGGEEVAEKIAKILGVESKTGTEKVAQLLCKGGINKTKLDLKYKGIETCKAAATINAGAKSCQYGCMSFGDCVEVCPFDAIELNEQGLPEIDFDKCTGCGKCVDACPRDILVLAPEDAENHIRCSSHDSGNIVRKICEVGCIGCGICAKTCPVDAITMEDNLAVIDYEKCINCGLCAEKCPTGTIEFYGDKIEEIHITENCVGCTRCVQPCPVDAIEGEIKEQHEIDEEKCIKCGICYDTCKVDGAIEVRYEEDKK